LWLRRGSVDNLLRLSVEDLLRLRSSIENLLRLLLSDIDSIRLSRLRNNDLCTGRNSDMLPTNIKSNLLRTGRGGKVHVLGKSFEVKMRNE
jgi:hypothetical protein